MTTELTATRVESSARDSFSRFADVVRRTIASVDSAKVDSTVVNLRTTSANLEKLSRALDSTRVAVNSVVTKVNSGPGTVGKFMNDPAVYARIDTLLLRLDSIALDFKKNPRRYINLKIF